MEWLRFFENISGFFREFFLFPLWNKYNNHPNDIWYSLAIFLEGYAFERQGRRPDYSHAAVDALFECRNENNGNMNQNVADDIWQRFRNLLNNQNLNRKNNPLYPSTDPDGMNLRGTPSVIEVVQDQIAQQNLTLTAYLQNQIVENNIRNAFRWLNQARGIGDKIASLYLRDLAFVINIDLENIESRHLLQPIDTWVARTIETLGGNMFLHLQERINQNNLRRRDKEDLASWIVENSNQTRVNPELVNMGIWFFSSQIAVSKYRLNRALNNIDHANTLFDEYANRFNNVCQNCQHLLQI